MAADLQSTPLRNCLEKVIDYRGKTPKKLGSDWANEGYRALSAINVKDSGLTSLDSIRYLDEETYRRWMREEVQRGDILLTSEAPAGEVMIWDSEEKIVLSQRLFCLRTNKQFDNRFIKYYLQSPTGKREVNRTRSGSTVAGISAEMFDQIQVVHPSLTEQRRIATVLSAIDAKIDLNNRINVELEALATTIYDYWFVQFDFPDANGRPYKTSGGNMIWNETLKREIPAGWGESDITAAAEVAGGATPSKAIPSYWQGNIPFFTPTDASGSVFQLTTESSIAQSGLDSCSSELFEKGTVFITARGSVGRLAIAGCAMAMNQSCYALKPRTPSTYPYVFLHAKTLIHHLKVKASGSTFNSIVTNDIEWTRLVSPEPGAIAEFCKTVRPMFDRIETAHRENLELSQLRDWLLPLLMNGQVKPADL